MAQGEKLNDVFNVDWSGGLFTQGHLNVMCESHVYYNESGQKSKFYKMMTSLTNSITIMKTKSLMIIVLPFDDDMIDYIYFKTLLGNSSTENLHKQFKSIIMIFHHL